MPKEKKLHELPADVLQNIATHLDPKTQGNLRVVSKSTRQSVAVPFAEERDQLNKLIEVFKAGDLQETPDSSGIFDLHVSQGRKIIWDVRLEYRGFPGWKHLTICKYREDGFMDGAIRIDFRKHRLQSYKAGNKTWLVAFILTVSEWVSDYEKYKDYLHRNAFMDIRIHETYNHRIMVHPKDLMMIARYIWIQQPQEDRLFVRDLMRRFGHTRNPRPPVDEGRAITLRMREASKRREAFLNEGMLGHNAAVAKFLTKKGNEERGKKGKQ